MGGEKRLTKRLTVGFANRSHKSLGAWYCYFFYRYNKTNRSKFISGYFGQRGEWFNPLAWKFGFDVDLANLNFDLSLIVIYFNFSINR